MARNEEREEDGREELSLPAGEWRKAKIAYNAEGNIVILDPEVAEIVRRGALADRELDVGLPPRKVSLEEEPLPEEVRKDNPVVRPRNDLCACDLLHLHLIKVLPVAHELLSDQRRRRGR